MSVLITGVSGALAGIVTQRLLEDGHEVVGLDVRPLPMGRAFGGEFYRVRRYTQRRVAEVYRRHKPKILIHLGRIRGTAVRSLNQRYNQNVLGTRIDADDPVVDVLYSSEDDTHFVQTLAGSDELADYTGIGGQESHLAVYHVAYTPAAFPAPSASGDRISTATMNPPRAWGRPSSSMP